MSDRFDDFIFGDDDFFGDEFRFNDDSDEYYPDEEDTIDGSSQLFPGEKISFHKRKYDPFYLEDHDTLFSDALHSAAGYDDFFGSAFESRKGDSYAGRNSSGTATEKETPDWLISPAMEAQAERLKAFAFTMYFNDDESLAVHLLTIAFQLNPALAQQPDVVVLARLLSHKTDNYGDAILRFDKKNPIVLKARESSFSRRRRSISYHHDADNPEESVLQMTDTRMLLNMIDDADLQKIIHTADESPTNAIKQIDIYPSVATAGLRDTLQSGEFSSRLAALEDAHSDPPDDLIDVLETMIKELPSDNKSSDVGSDDLSFDDDDDLYFGNEFYFDEFE